MHTCQKQFGIETIKWLLFSIHMKTKSNCNILQKEHIDQILWILRVSYIRVCVCVCDEAKRKMYDEWNEIFGFLFSVEDHNSDRLYIYFH